MNAAKAKILEAAIAHMNMHGRIALCGMIGHYNATEPAPGPRNLMLAVGKRLALQGFIVSDHEERRADFYADGLVPFPCLVALLCLFV